MIIQVKLEIFSAKCSGDSSSGDESLPSSYATEEFTVTIGAVLILLLWTPQRLLRLYNEDRRLKFQLLLPSMLLRIRWVEYC